MAIVILSIVIFILTFGAGYLGMLVKKRLAEEHLSSDTRGVVGQVAGLLTLLLALVLGTLIGVSYAYFSTQKTELEGFSPRFCGSIRRPQNMGRRQSQRATSSRRELSRVMRRSGEAETSIPMR
jgi:hypothetical protein